MLLLFLTTECCLLYFKSNHRHSHFVTDTEYCIVACSGAFLVYGYKYELI